MAFQHETFWVAAATAAPVIALANQVTLIDSLGVLQKFKTALDDSRLRQVHDAAMRGRRAAIRAYYVGFANLIAQAFMLLAALTALARIPNTAFPPLAVIVVEVAGLLALGDTSLSLARVRAILTRLDAESARNVTRSSSGQPKNIKDAGEPKNLEVDGGDTDHV